jgi:hypothetical protein
MKLPESLLACFLIGVACLKLAFQMRETFVIVIQNGG